jgi:PAS domain S-box-containing protein
VITSWNRGAQRLFGYTAEEAVGRSVTIIIPTDRHDEEPMILERVRRDESHHYETVRQRKDGSLVDISLAVSPIKDEKGEIVGASKIARDFTQLKRARERQELLLREMDHRVKNLFALAISVLRLSGRSALARAHALTLSSGLRDIPHAAKPATLYSLLQAITAPHDVPGDLGASKFSVTGCDMEISGSAVSSLALLLNEFATNATKYGALSTTAGQIRIQCTNHGETLVVIWTERGGPAVVSPTGNNGFGDLLVRTTIAVLGGEISRDWRPEGLVIRLSIPREGLTRWTTNHWDRADSKPKSLQSSRRCGGQMKLSPNVAWDQMTLDQKFVFIAERADNLTDAKRSLQIELHSLLGKLLSIDSKLSTLTQKLNRKET